MEGQDGCRNIPKNDQLWGCFGNLDQIPDQHFRWKTINVMPDLGIGSMIASDSFDESLCASKKCDRRYSVLSRWRPDSRVFCRQFHSKSRSTTRGACSENYLSTGNGFFGRGKAADCRLPAAHRLHISRL